MSMLTMQAEQPPSANEVPQRNFPKRATAVHALVCELLEGSYVRGDAETGEASFVESGGEKFSRACLVGTVVEKGEDDGGLPAISLLDSTGIISVRALDERGAKALAGINKGGDALVIGKAREKQERFIAVESAFPLDDLNWETAHLLRVALRKRR